MSKEYCLYCHENKTNGKKYIGITCQSPQQRWRKGNGYRNNAYFFRAISLYGWDGFTHTVLHTNLTKSEAESMEIQLIKKYDTTNTNHGYNIEKGGNGTEKFSDEIKRKISKSLKGHACSDETKKKISESKKGRPSPQKGVKRSPEINEKNRISHLGQKAWNKGIPWTDEDRAKLNGKSVVNISTNEVYRTMHEASRKTGVSYMTIWRHCNGKIKGNAKWKLNRQVTAEEITSLPK